MVKIVRYLAALGVVGALAVGVLLTRGPGSATPPVPAASRPAERPPIPVKVALVVERPMLDEVAFVAAVEPSVTTTMGAEVDGRIVELLVREGDPVVADQTVIARIDAGPREIQLREAGAAVVRAREERDKLRRGYRAEEIEQRAAEMAERKAIMDRAQEDLARARRLHDGGLISTAERDRFQAEYLASKEAHQRLAAAHRMLQAGPRPEEIAQAEADLAQAQARADRITDEVRRTVVRAAISGFVVKKHTDVGAWLRSGDKVADLIALDPVFVTGPVGEREVPRVQPGQVAIVNVDAHPGRTFRGRVSAIVPGADPASRTFPVRVTLENSERLLKAGMFARVAIRTGADRVGLFLPKDALVRRGGQQFVFLVSGDVATQVKVDTGPEDAGLVEVRGVGLAVGLRAVTLGNEFLQTGMKVVAP
jgi:multidrug efflux pump subunit AcrA (membrane-fusion protein)